MKHVSPQKKRQKLKKKLWDIFSLYVRTRDNFTCITCGQKGEGSAMHAGHFIPKSIGGLALRYDEGNVHAQCCRCNVHLGGWGERYAEVLTERFGSVFVDSLRKMRHNKLAEKDYDFEGKIAYYEQKLKELQNEGLRKNG